MKKGPLHKENVERGRFCNIPCDACDRIREALSAAASPEKWTEYQRKKEQHEEVKAEAEEAKDDSASPGRS